MIVKGRKRLKVKSAKATLKNQTELTVFFILKATNQMTRPFPVIPSKHIPDKTTIDETLSISCIVVKESSSVVLVSILPDMSGVRYQV